MVLKLHGAIDRADVTRDSYVLTEDSYIDYLAGRGRRADPLPAHGADGGQPLPFPRLLDARLEPAGDPEPDLGCAAARPQVVGGTARARRPGAREVEEALWRDRGDVDLLYVELKEYVPRVERELDASGSPA